MKIPKGSEAVNRWKTDNTMATKKRTNHNLQNITQKTKDRATRTPLKTSGVAKPSAWTIKYSMKKSVQSGVEWIEPFQIIKE